MPNVTLTREEFNIKAESIVNKERIRAGVSGFLDVNSKFMIVTKISEKAVKEIASAMVHLEILKQLVNHILKNSLVTTFLMGM